MLQDGRKLLFPHFHFFFRKHFFFLFFKHFLLALDYNFVTCHSRFFYFAQFTSIYQPAIFFTQKFHYSFLYMLKEWKISAALRRIHNIARSDNEKLRHEKRFSCCSQRKQFSTTESFPRFSLVLKTREDENFPSRESSRTARFLLLMNNSWISLK